MPVRGAKKFENVSLKVGEQFAKPLVARGAIYGDFDHDGDIDLASAGIALSPRSPEARG